MCGREAFEAWFSPRHPYTRIDGEVGKNMFAAWSARDAEIAAKDARIAELETVMATRDKAQQAALDLYCKRIAELEARICPWCDSPLHDKEVL